MDRPHDLTRDLTDEEREALRANCYRPVEVWSLDLNQPAVLQQFQSELRLIAEADREEGMAEVLDAFNAQLLENEPDYKW